MGIWQVDGTTEPGILNLRLEGTFSEDDMRAFVEAHNKGVDSFGKRDYRVFCDIRDLLPLSPACAALFEKAKAYSSAHKNFRGSSVWVKSAIIALQHKRTSQSGGVLDTELISDDEKALRAHLKTVFRK
jgi:hypothetical protein